MTYFKEPELTLTEHTAYEHGKSHALSGWNKAQKYGTPYNYQQWYLFGYERGLEEKKKQDLKDLILESP